MHRCLLVPELLEIICGECRQSPKIDLASLARTSRSFQEPALRHLWYELREIAPLIRCMPRDLWEVKGKNLVFRRAITERDWKTFEKYALRVRAINVFAPWSALRMSTEGYQSLSLAAGGRVLLPNITSVFWGYTSDLRDQSFPFIHLFLGPKLTTLAIWPPDIPSLSHISVLANLGTQCPALTTLTVNEVKDPRAVAALSTAVRHWNNLRCLVADAVSSDALIHLANLPSLQVLKLGNRYKDSTPTDFPSDFPHSNAFSSLRILRVSQHTFSFCTKLLNSMSDMPLTSIEFSGFRFCPTSGEWTDLLLAIQTVCRPSTLVNLEIDDHHPHVFGTECTHTHAHILTKDYLHFLLGFGNLQSVKLTTVGVFDIDDATVKDMAIAWPKIKTLWLVGDATEVRITLDGLRPLAEHCPELKDLSLAFDARSVPPTKATPRIFCRLNHLNVQNSPIQDWEGVAAFLSDIFPTIECLESWFGVGGRLYEKWLNVRVDMRLEFESVHAQAETGETLVDTL